MTADLTVAAAFVAGLLSFLSPCVLPVVPAYLGQLGAVSVSVAAEVGVATLAAGWDRRWTVMRHALAFVLGFGSVFTVLGVSATYAGQALAPQLPFLRQVGGLLLVILGLNLAGILRIPVLARTWRPLEAGTSGTVALAPSRPTPLGPFGLGAIFALGWTPCIGPTLGAIFGLAAAGSSAPALVLFVAYSAGLGVPFLLLGFALEEAPRLIRPLRRHARTVEVLGGALVALVGLSLIFDWLPWFAARFSFLTPRV